MIKTTNARVLAFIEYVEETYPQEVVDMFMDELNKCQNQAIAELGPILQNAKDNSPNAAERKKLELSKNERVTHICNF